MAWIIPHQRAALTFTEAEVAFLFPGADQPPRPDPFQAAPLADRHPVHDAAADAGDQPPWRPCLDSRGRLVADSLHHQPAPARFVLCADAAAGSRHHQLAAAAGHSGPGARPGGVVVVWARQTMPAFDLSRLRTTGGHQGLLPASPDRRPRALSCCIRSGWWCARSWRRTRSPSSMRSGRRWCLMLLHYVVGRALERRVRRSLGSRPRRSWPRRSPPSAPATGRRRRRNPSASAPPFKLRPTGPPAVALLWKNLISAGQAFTLRIWISLAVLRHRCASLGVTQASSGSGLRPALGMIAAHAHALVAADRRAIAPPGFPPGPPASRPAQDLPPARLAACPRRTPRPGGDPDLYPVAAADCDGRSVLAIQPALARADGAGWAWRSALLSSCPCST